MTNNTVLQKRVMHIVIVKYSFRSRTQPDMFKSVTILRCTILNKIIFKTE